MEWNANSLQGYLERHLKVATNITPELIKELKAQWRKDYVARYNKQYRDDNVQITFRLSKSQYQKLKAIANSEDIKPTVYCKDIVIHRLNDNTIQDLQSLKLQLLELIDAVEEAQYEDQELPIPTLLTKLQHMLDVMLS